MLVDFWTYTCINWLRTLGYVRAWAEKYAGDGLVVVGVHTPEFPFEHDPENVREAVREMRVSWPIVLDNDYRVWNAFANHYWPAVYIADAEGAIRHHQYGEGGYEECERAIQELLGVTDGLVSPSLDGFEVQADWSTLRSPETYLGSQQAENHVSGDGDLRRNQWTLEGDWSIEPRASVLRTGEGSIVFRFHARDVNLVLGPRERGAAVPFTVLLDGDPPGEAHGFDVDERGAGTLTQQRLHQLIRQHGPIEDRTVEIVFSEPGAEAYCFTFG